MHGYPGQSPHTARPLWRGRAVGVFPRIPFNQRHRRQGRGMLHPPPRQPHPVGAIPRRYSVVGSGSIFAVSPDTPRRSCLSPCTAIRVNRPSLPAPLWRGREEAAVAAGRWGCFHEYRSARDTGDREGDLPPPPRQPHPVAAIPHGYSVGGSGSLFAVSPDTPERSCLSPCTGYPPGLSSCTHPPPSRRGGGL